jgi:hypothetical protein
MIRIRQQQSIRADRFERLGRANGGAGVADNLLLNYRVAVTARMEPDIAATSERTRVISLRELLESARFVEPWPNLNRCHHSPPSARY